MITSGRRSTEVVATSSKPPSKPRKPSREAQTPPPPPPSPPTMASLAELVVPIDGSETPWTTGPSRRSSPGGSRGGTKTGQPPFVPRKAVLGVSEPAPTTGYGSSISFGGYTLA
ncbi:hypothetical protein VE03_10399 [Pseudogymnoascus sp. 23342-1-I1]|nr:hypothetical protein VE03_10399 [Pseudogymnoascus sp. 23342-1-I1]